MPEEDGSSFEAILGEAEERLWSVFRRATRLQHRGTKGRVREEGVARFLRQQLPDRFAVHEGEAIDGADRRSTQLDIVVFDGANVSPLWIDDFTVLIPAESLLAVVEVKTRLTRAEVANCCRAIHSIAELCPRGDTFIPARSLGAHADDGRMRCFYSVVAFETDLGADDWVSKEWNRLLEVCAEEGVDARRFDRILVLDRGLLVPPHSRVREVADEPVPRLLGHWFLHLAQFLSREAARRPPFEWTPYGDRDRGWRRLDPEVPRLAGDIQDERRRRVIGSRQRDGRRRRTPS